MKTQHLKINEAADLIKVSPWTIRNWIKKRKLKHYKFGGVIRIREEDLLGFAKEIFPRDSE